MFIETYNIFTKSFSKVLTQTNDDNIVDLILLGLNYITKLAILYILLFYYYYNYYLLDVMLMNVMKIYFICMVNTVIYHMIY